MSKNKSKCRGKKNTDKNKNTETKEVTTAKDIVKNAKNAVVEAKTPVTGKKAIEAEAMKTDKKTVVVKVKPKLTKEEAAAKKLLAKNKKAADKEAYENKKKLQLANQQQQAEKNAKKAAKKAEVTPKVIPKAEAEPKETKVPFVEKTDETTSAKSTAEKAKEEVKKEIPVIVEPETTSESAKSGVEKPITDSKADPEVPDEKAITPIMNTSKKESMHTNAKGLDLEYEVSTSVGGNETIKPVQTATCGGVHFQLYVCNGVDEKGNLMKITNAKTLKKFRQANGQPTEALANAKNKEEHKNLTKQIRDIVNGKKRSIINRVATILPTYIGLVGTTVICWDNNTDFKKGEKLGHTMGMLLGFSGGKKNFVVDIELETDNDQTQHVLRSYGHVMPLEEVRLGNSHQENIVKATEVTQEAEKILITDKRMDDVEFPKGYTEAIAKDSFVSLLTWNSPYGGDKAVFHSVAFKDVDGETSYKWAFLDSKGQAKTSFLPMRGSQAELLRATVLTMQGAIPDMEVMSFAEDEFDQYEKWCGFFFDLENEPKETYSVSEVVTGVTNEETEPEQQTEQPQEQAS